MTITRSWREQKIMLKMRFPDLTDQDFLIKDDNKEEMLVRLAKKLRKTREELELLFTELQKY